MSERTCCWCGESIAHRNARAKACGELCAQQARRHPGKTLKELMTRSCLGCGVDISHMALWARCCGYRCSWWVRTHPGQPYPKAKPRQCAACLADISHLSIQAQTCSAICGYWVRAHPGEIRTLTDGNPCRNCGKPLRGKRTDALFCSRNCKNKAKQALYRAENRYPLAEFFARNPGKKSEYHNRRRSLKYGNSGYVEVTTKEWAIILRIYRHRCAYCGAAEDLTQDHVVPLVKGGRHAPANIVPACRSCNSSKNARLLAVWRLEQRKGGSPHPFQA